MTVQQTRKFLRFLLYAAFFVVCFIVSLLITFPYERLAGFAEARASEAAGMPVTIGSIRPTVFGGVYAEDVAVGPAPPGPLAKGTPSTAPYVRIDEIDVGMSWLGLLFGEVDSSFDGVIADGPIEGEIEHNETHTAATLELNDLNTKRLGIIRDKLGLPVLGKLTTKIEFDIPTGNIETAKGKLAINLRGGVIGDGKAKLSLGSLMGFGSPSDSADDGTPIPPLALGPISIKSKLVDGEFEISKVEASSDDVDLTLEGRIKLAEPLSNSRVDLYLTVKLSEEWGNSTETTKTITTMLDNLPQVKRARRTDGSLGFKISGTFKRGVTFRPAKNFTIPGRRRRGKNRRNKQSKRGKNRRRPPRAPSARKKGKGPGRIKARPTPGRFRPGKVGPSFLPGQLNGPTPPDLGQVEVEEESEEEVDEEETEETEEQSDQQEDQEELE